MQPEMKGQIFVYTYKKTLWIFSPYFYKKSHNLCSQLHKNLGELRTEKQQYISLLSEWLCVGGWVESGQVSSVEKSRPRAVLSCLVCLVFYRSRLMLTNVKELPACLGSDQSLVSGLDEQMFFLLHALNLQSIQYCTENCVFVDLLRARLHYLNQTAYWLVSMWLGGEGAVHSLHFFFFKCTNVHANQISEQHCCAIRRAAENCNISAFSPTRLHITFTGT